MLISQIFAEQGEEGFRKLEHEALQIVIEKYPRAIVSTGGGAPCFFDNLEKMKRAGRTVYVDVPLKTLITRTSKSSKRPLLQGNHEEQITALLKERERIYNKADIVFSTNGRDSLEVAREIANLVV